MQYSGAPDGTLGYFILSALATNKCSSSMNFVLGFSVKAMAQHRAMAFQVHRLSHVNRGRVVLGHPHMATGAMKRLAFVRHIETSFNEHNEHGHISHTRVLWN